MHLYLLFICEFDFACKFIIGVPLYVVLFGPFFFHLLGDYFGEVDQGQFVFFPSCRWWCVFSWVHLCVGMLHESFQ